MGKAIVIANGHGGVRTVAVGQVCVACVWAAVPECSFHPSSQGPVHEPDACNNASGKPVCRLGTGRPGIPYREEFSSTGPNGPWSFVRDVCLGEQPISTDALFAQVKNYVDRLIPAAPQVGMQPHGVAIVNLPTLFQAGQPTDPGNQPASKVFFANAGAPIAMNVAVHPQQWTFTIDTTTTVSRDYCCRYYASDHSPRIDPTYYAAHDFTDTGTHTATVTVNWTATMTITGLGTVPVDGTFTRTSRPYAFVVKEARAQIESGG